MATKTRQRTQKQTAPPKVSRAGDRDEIKVVVQKVKISSNDPVKEFNNRIRDVISENDISYLKLDATVKQDIVDKWWEKYVNNCTAEWCNDINEFCRNVVESSANIQFDSCGYYERRFDYYHDEKRVGMVIIRKDAKNPITLKMNKT